MVVGMNASKQKGDRAEREAVAILVAAAPLLVLPTARRKLGAGRKDDMGDLDVFDGVTIQVKALANLARGLRSAAVGAAEQAIRANNQFALGLTPIPRARASAVRWLAGTLTWPGNAPDPDELAHFGITELAVAHARNEKIGVPRVRRIAVVERADMPDLYVAPVEAWIAEWERERLAYSLSPPAPAFPQSLVVASSPHGSR
jgi:hypothetical protein